MASSDVTDAPRRRLHLRDIGRDPRILLMLALGFSSGLPLLLVLGTFSTRLAYSNVDIKAIGLFSYLALPYTLKFLWAPIIDRFDVPGLSRVLGRRRGWMIATQAAVAVALALMASADPGTSLALLGLGAFLVAICAATQDVVIDGWRIDAAGTDLQGVMAATSNLGYRLALMSAGAGALFIASAYGWSVAYLSMAALMGVGMVAALLAPAYDRAITAPVPAAPADVSTKAWTFRSAVLEPLTELHTRLGASLWAILILVAFYRMPDFISGVMASPLYKTVGFTLVDIGFVSKLYGIWVGIAGAFVGGWAMTRYGLFPTLVVGAFLGAASNLAFSWLSFGGPEVWRLTAAISIDNFCGSFAGMALIAYMSSLTAPGFAATQYALFSSLYALPGKLVAGTSGFIVAAYGYPVFFALTAAVGIPVVVLCLFVGRAGERRAAAAETVAADPVRPEAAAGDEIGGNHPRGLGLASTGNNPAGTAQTGRPRPAHG
ncbi:AmpG family muropeptide MFS transporter [Methylobacterium sp. J-068]|uniref:AmpG family muropeptide MFS transporter n=1 Tax=Methylobacterium sp. J-068 TaxID=2836649 RepID=UPI001FBA6F92|nr:MFS transporter [Methylobacterium sp. J-068]MCJ2034616.1 MFS transporter [Methylobacterium sp. J-068]